jgi:hypothetical protein
MYTGLCTMADVADGSVLKVMIVLAVRLPTCFPQTHMIITLDAEEYSSSNSLCRRYRIVL